MQRTQQKLSLEVCKKFGEYQPWYYLENCFILNLIRLVDSKSSSAANLIVQAVPRMHPLKKFWNKSTNSYEIMTLNYHGNWKKNANKEMYERVLLLNYFTGSLLVLYFSLHYSISYRKRLECFRVFVIVSPFHSNLKICRQGYGPTFRVEYRGRVGSSSLLTTVTSISLITGGQGWSLPE